MSLLSEAVATVSQFSSSVTNTIVLSPSTVFEQGVNYVSVTGKVVPAGPDTYNIVLDVVTGEPINLTGYSVDYFIVQSKPPLVVDMDPVNFGIGGSVPGNPSNFSFFTSGFSYSDVNNILNSTLGIFVSLQSFNTKPILTLYQNTDPGVVTQGEIYITAKLALTL